MSTPAFPIGPDVRVNTITDGAQFNPAITELKGGGFVVTWVTENAQGGIGFDMHAQRYNALGVPLGPEFLVTTQVQSTPAAVAGLSDGGFVVTWEQSGTSDIYARRYSAAGETAAPEFLVNSAQAGFQQDVAVTGLTGGGYVITWMSSSGDGDGYGIFGQRYSAAGGLLGGNFQVNTYAVGNQVNPTVTAVNDGGFIVTWTSPEAVTSTTEIEARRYNSAGVPLGEGSRVNPNQTGDQTESSAATLNDGRVVFTWTSNGEDGSGLGVYGRIGLGAAFRINDTTEGDQSRPSVTALKDGGFLVTWSSLGQDGSGWGVYGKQYDSTGFASIAEFRVNATTEGHQRAATDASLVTLADGQVVQVWGGASVGIDELYYRFISTQGTAARDDAYVLLAGHGLTADSAIGLLANDEVASLPAIKTVITGHGVIDTNADGTFSYFPQSFTGVDHLRYTFADPLDGSLETANVSIYVVPVTVGPTSTTLNLVALTAEEQIAATYVAFFGRGADAPGFDFWVNQFDVGLPQKGPSGVFAAIASSFGVGDEAKALYPFLGSPNGASDSAIASFINGVYENLFNRGSDAEGLAYWTAQTKATLQAGGFVGSILINIMSGAQDTVAGKDITTLMSKVAVSLHYVEAQKELHTEWTWADDLAGATTLIDNVTSAASTVLVGIANADHLVAADVL